MAGSLPRSLMFKKNNVCIHPIGDVTNIGLKGRDINHCRASCRLHPFFFKSCQKYVFTHKIPLGFISSNSVVSRVSIHLNSE